MNYHEFKKNIRDAIRGVKVGLSKTKILVVEFDETTVTMLLNALKGMGFLKIDRVRRCEQALNCLERERYDLYFINYRLKGEDMGINFVDHLYAYGYHEQAVVILLLGDKEKIPDEFPPEYNSDGILRKPYKTAKISCLVSDALDKKIARVETSQLMAQSRHRDAVILNLQAGGREAHKIWGTLSAGDIYEIMDNNEDAITVYRAILKHFPRCAIAYDAIGLVMRKMGRNTEAEHHFISAADRNPYYLRAKHHLAELYYWNGNKEKAREILKLALRINPLNLTTNKDLAQVSMDLGDYEAAKKSLKVVLQDRRHAENPNVLMDYGNALMMNKELDEALTVFSQSIEKCKTQEDIEEHGKILKRALSAKGNCYLRYEDPEMTKLAEGCFKAAEKAMEKKGASPEEHDEFKLELAKSYLEHGLDPKAEETLESFIDRDPKNKGRQEKVTGIFALFNKVNKAMELIEKAIQKSVDNIEARDRENRKLRKEGKFYEAVESYKELIERYPSDDGLHFNCGRTYMEWSKRLEEVPGEGVGKRNHALQHFRAALDLDPERIAPALAAIGVDEKDIPPSTLKTSEK